MRFRIEGELPASADDALRVYHDRIETIGARLPNVARVEVLERAPEMTRLKWYAKGDIPRAFHKVLGPEDLFWEDEAAWDPVERLVTFKVFRPNVKTVKCETQVRFEASGNGCSFRCDGDLRIEVPLFGPMLERFFVGHVEDNWRKFFDLLADETRPGPTGPAPPASAQ